DTEPVDVEELYGRLEDLGVDYGPAFRGLRAAWRREQEIFAEVALAEEQRGEASGFHVHPALLDAALHGSSVGFFERMAAGASLMLQLPFAWRDVSASTRGASTLRVRLTPLGEDGVSLVALDERGEPVATVGSLLTRAVAIEQLGASGARESLFGL